MKYLTFRDLQNKLGGRGRTTIYRDVELGRLPKPVKIGSRLYWPEEAALHGTWTQPPMERVTDSN